MQETLTIAGVEYLKCGVIGEGGAGIVHLARDPSNKYYAIKTVRDYNNPIIKDSVDMQIQIQKQFTGNPNVIQYIAVETTRKVAHIVLQIGACSLRNIIDHRNIRQNEFLCIICDLCQGLFSIHEQGVIHRDIKPENVIFKGGIYKITDFGISFQGSEDQSTTGTINYMAPQILFQSKETFTKKVDIWSMGVTAFEVLFKIHPFLPQKIHSYKERQKQLKKNIQELTPQFSMQRFVNLLMSKGMEKEAGRVQKKMQSYNKQILDALCSFFQPNPEKRQDISYYCCVFESIRSSIPYLVAKKVKINIQNKEIIPVEIKMMVNALNLVYELDAETPCKFKNQVTFSIQLAIWFLTGVTYGEVHYIIPQHLETLKNHLKSKEQVWEDVRSGTISYYFSQLKQNEAQLDFFQKLCELRLHILMVANWSQIINRDKVFKDRIKAITNFQINHPLEMLKFVTMYSDKHIHDIESMIMSQFYG